ncbi:hypothetical protein M0R45_001265 [Rubus argutus]|uniref:F-box associated beta-propeller type 1 domain-containing protein n=1 Tax=Rubus argutus TaxID=59490 RepID=A0AAW1VL73_RUBAR
MSLQIQPASTCYSHGHFRKAHRQNPLQLQVRLQRLASRNLRPSICSSTLSEITHGDLDEELPRLNISRKLHFTHVEESPDSQYRLEKIRFTPQNSLPISDCCLINSCNGLVLVGSKKGDPFYVCNPIFGEYITLPCGHYDSFVGLGFSAATNEYKVLQTKLFKDFVYIEAKVYTIGGKRAWRSIGHAPFDFVNWNFNAYVHGALHWVSVASFSVSIVIRSFDFEREEFEVVLPPGNFGGREKQFSECVKVGVLRDSLVLCVYTDDPSKFDLWVMKDYGVQESWTKILVLEDNYPRGRGLDFYQPMVFLSNGDILMSYNNEDVVCYNKEMKGFTETKITGTGSVFRAIAYTPCLVSLRDVSKGEKVKRY